MRGWLSLALAALLIGSATPSLAQNSRPSRYSVAGLAVGERVNFDTNLYRQYKCNPSEQFEGFTWCQLKKEEREKRGSFATSYSILHSRDGIAVYINRFQEPAFWAEDEVNEDIQRYSRAVGEEPKIFKMPSRPGLPDGIIAAWGNVLLEPLDAESRKILASGASVRRGILLDFLGNYTRSAREDLPIYRLTGGAGFVWAASNKSGRGTLRFLAINPSAFSVAPSQPPIATPSVPPPQQQQVPQTGDANYSTVGWWSIIYRRTGNLSGCMASSRFQDQTLLQIALIQSGTSQKEWAIFISNPRWNTWIARKRQHVLRFMTQKLWWGNFSADNENVLSNYSASIDFMNGIADADGLRIFSENNVSLTSLNMKDSAAAIRAVVNCVREHPYVPPPEPEIIMSGTGFFVAPNLLVTNNHVIKECTKPIQVRYPERESYVATIYGQDNANDLALLRTGMSNRSVASFRFQPRLGERVATYGFPYSGLLSSSGNFTLGDITALSGMKDDTRFLQISTPTQPGNSGGPLLDMSGRVVGVVVAQLSAMTMMAAEGSVPQNVNFAIQPSIVTNFLSAKGVTPKVDNSGTDAKPRDLSPPDVADIAKEFTVQIYCQGAPGKVSSDAQTMEFSRGSNNR
jgi:serine protease Do